MQLSEFVPDAQLEKDGVWIPYDEEVSFLLAYYGKPSYNDKLRRLGFAARRKNHKRTLGQEEENSLIIEAMIGTTLLDWKGLEEGFDGDGKGVLLPFNAANAKRVMTQSIELFRFVTTEMTLLENFQPPTKDMETEVLPGGSPMLGEGASAELKSGTPVDADLGT